MKKYKKNEYCGNCGKLGHIYKRCTEPITSLGIILFTIEDNIIKYLMIQRRDTLGFVEFMRGKYNLQNIQYVKSLYEIMTKDERDKLENNDFDYLWEKLWMKDNVKQYHNEYENSKKKFQLLKNGIMFKNELISLKLLNNTVVNNYFTPEWGFPKGRRNLKENNLDCANREFQEETGIKYDKYSILKNINSFSETFLGTNNIKYKHIYYIAKYRGFNKNFKINKNNFNQVSEVSDINFYTYEECLDLIRPYNQEKKDMLSEIHKKISEFINK